MILILVLVLVLIITLTGYGFTSIMVGEYGNAVLGSQQTQARALSDSGIAATRAFLLQDEQARSDAGGRYDNPALFLGIAVTADTGDGSTGRFTIVSPALDAIGDYNGLRYGLQDESARLNLNVLPTIDKALPGTGRTLLMALPGMTEDIADAILDWVDDDEDARELGVERSYYESLSPAYSPKNGPLDTVEELLLVRGMTPDLLFGADINRNYIIEPSEQDQFAQSSLSGIAGAEFGWAPYLTLHSKERNTTFQGERRIYLNTPDLDKLYNQLLEKFDSNEAQFIVAYRLYGPHTPADEEEEATAATGRTVNLDLGGTPTVDLTSVLDLLETFVQIPGDEEAPEDDPAAEPILLQSPETNSFLAKLMEYGTTSSSLTIPGRLHLLEAPATLLAGLPGLDEETLQAILDRRAQTTTEDFKLTNPYETWLFSEGLVDLATMKQLIPLVCMSGDVFRGQSVGFFDDSAVASRSEFIIDATRPEPRLVFLRDLSHMGRGFDSATLGGADASFP